MAGAARCVVILLVASCASVGQDFILDKIKGFALVSCKKTFCKGLLNVKGLVIFNISSIKNDVAWLGIGASNSMVPQ